MRLLLVVDSLEIGGAERHVVDLSVVLHRRGHVVIVACSMGGPLAMELEREGIEVHIWGKRLVKRQICLPFAWWLRGIVRRREIQVIHTHMYAALVAGVLASWGSELPLLHTEHSEALWHSRSTRLVCRLAYRRPARIIAVSEPIRRRLIERDGVPGDRVRVVACAVPEKTEETRVALPIQPAGRRSIGVIARLQPEKGVGVFLMAMAKVAQQAPDCAFVVVGDGPLRGTLEAQARRLGLAGRVSFWGLQPDARSLLSLFDILVVPSLSEGAPLVVLEAMSAGVPIVASAIGAIPDQLRHEQEGLLVPPADHGALSAAVLRLLDDRDLARRCSEAGRSRARTFRHDDMVTQTERVYGLGSEGTDGFQGVVVAQ